MSVMAWSLSSEEREQAQRLVTKHKDTDTIVTKVNTGRKIVSGNLFGNKITRLPQKNQTGINSVILALGVVFFSRDLFWMKQGKSTAKTGVGIYSVLFFDRIITAKKV